MMTVMLAINTLDRIGLVTEYGAAPGVPRDIGSVMLAASGFLFMAACLGTFFLLATRDKLFWWVALALPVCAAANVWTAIAIVPDEHVGLPLVLDVYFFNGVLTVVLLGLLLTRSVRRYFGISGRQKESTPA